MKKLSKVILSFFMILTMCMNIPMNVKADSFQTVTLTGVIPFKNGQVVQTTDVSGIAATNGEVTVKELKWACENETLRDIDLTGGVDVLSEGSNYVLMVVYSPNTGYSMPDNCYYQKIKVNGIEGNSSTYGENTYIAHIYFTAGVGTDTHTYEWKNELSSTYHDYMHYQLCTEGDGIRKNYNYHTYEDTWHVEVEPTVTSYGKEYKECEICGYKMYTDIPKSDGKLSKVSVTGITEPVNGETPATNVSSLTASTGIKVNSITWKQGSTVLQSTDTFVGGNTYTVNLSISLETGYSIPNVSSTEVTLDGNTVDSFSADGSNYTIVYSYKAKQSLLLSGIPDVEAGNRGERLQLI